MANIKNNSVSSKQKPLNKNKQKRMKPINRLISKLQKRINKASRKINEIIKIRIKEHRIIILNVFYQKLYEIRSETYIKGHSDSLVNLEQNNLKNRKDML